MEDEKKYFKFQRIMAENGESDAEKPQKIQKIQSKTSKEKLLED